MAVNWKHGQTGDNRVEWGANIELTSPDAVQNGAVGRYSHVDVGDDDVVLVAFPLVGEEQVGHPHFARIVQSQIFDFTFKSKPNKSINPKPTFDHHLSIFSYFLSIILLRLPSIESLLRPKWYQACESLTGHTVVFETIVQPFFPERQDNAVFLCKFQTRADEIQLLIPRVGCK